jgi:hypothetical protein
VVVPSPPLVDTVSSFLARHSDRRGFLRRSALVGTALAAAPTAYALRPGSAYAAVCSCSGSSCDCGARCCDGYTEFCCTLNGQNRCPPGSIMAGWWKADGSGFCGSNAPRYYMDCNASCGTCGCGGGGTCAGSCSGTRCGCANGSCGNRKAGCTRFRYGQCNQAVRCVGPIICRVVSCSPPWSFDASCTTAVATDNNTRFHDAACLHAAPRPRPALATFRDGVWRIRRRVESGAPELQFSYGQPGDVPLVGDWNGDGGVGIGVRRGATFILRNAASAGAPDHIFDWGRPTDRVFTGDWNGNGTTGVGLRRGRTWYLKNFLDGRPHEIQFDWGRPDDIPIVGDWNGDGRVGVGLLRGSTWFLKHRLDGSPHEIQFTWAPPAPAPTDPLAPPDPLARDLPVALDWNDNVTTGVGLVRSVGDDLVWYTKNAFDGGQNQRQLTFGQAGDIPLAFGVPRT